MARITDAVVRMATTGQVVRAEPGKCRHCGARIHITDDVAQDELRIVNMAVDIAAP